MRRKSLGLLADVAKALSDIRSFTRGMTVDDYRVARLTKMAVERCFEIAGEALTRLRNSDLETFAKVPDAAKVIGFRNIIAHGYDIIKDAETWETVERNVPTLAAEIERLIAENENAAE